MTTRLVLVGGFLGAGKTTLLWEAARRIIGRGKRVGLVTNDQAPELVDTAFLAHGGMTVAEVSGSCFCCNFPGLLDAMAKARAEARADVLLAEPVGSCTDLSATIVQPLKDRCAREVETAPLTVMADPFRLADILAGGTAGLHPSAAYIFRKQLEESDIVLINKSDTLAPRDLAALTAKVEKAFPSAMTLTASAKSGDGVDAWLDLVLDRTDAGTRLADVDYDVYAEGEAVLGWLNATVALQGNRVDWDDYARRFLGSLSSHLDGSSIPVGHVKIFLEAGGKSLVGNVTGKGDTLAIRGSAGTGSKARFTVNARVQTQPDALAALVKEMLEASGKGQVKTKQVAWRCLSPGRPNPTHRYRHVVK